MDNGVPQTLEFDVVAFAKLGGGVAVRRQKLVSSFLSALDSNLVELSTAMAVLDAATVRAVAHRIKSGARWVGAYRLGELAEALELAPVGDDEMAVLTGRLAELLCAAAVARQRIEAELAAQPAG